MKYDFKGLEELAWGTGYAVLSFVLTAFVASEGVTNWRSWVIGVAIGGARAGAGYALSRLSPAAPKPVAAQPQTGTNTGSTPQS